MPPQARNPLGPAPRGAAAPKGAGAPRPAAGRGNDSSDAASFAVRFGPTLLAIGVVAILALILIPLPTFMLDILLSLSISSSLIMLMVVLFTEKQIHLTGFPTILLLLTLLRLGLNIASTRQILSQAYAGRVIEAFGHFVVAGNYVVGTVMFSIITIIQFMVITKGATRVAEVAARFTLDSMPGKQMAIDADLNAGLIDELQAVQRREEIQQKADFYGAMDGASKFVRGDAMAGLLITVINVVGGLIIGMVQHHMPLLKSLSTYTLLSIGDGLVSQVPALLTSVTAGIIVAKSSSERLLGAEISGQVLRQPKAFLVASGVLITLALVPGMPFVPFAIMAGLSISVYGIASRGGEQAPSASGKPGAKGAPGAPGAEGAPAAPATTREMFGQMVRIDPMEIEIGYGLIPLIDREQGGDILDRIAQIRKQCAGELGLVVPPIRIRDNMELPANAYHVKIKGLRVAEGEIRVRHLLAMKPGDDYQSLEGIRATEPAFGLPALWISESARTKAEGTGFTVVEPSSVLATHITELIRRYADSLLTRQDAQELIDAVREQAPAVVGELIPNTLSVGAVHRILQNLLRERVPIKDTVTIFETLADYALMTKDVDVLTEYVRRALAGHITRQYEDASGRIHVLTLDPKLEHQLTEAMQRSDKTIGLNLDPALAQQLTHRVAEKLDQPAFLTSAPVLLCAPLIRRALRGLLERNLPHLAVLSYNEILPSARVETQGSVGLVLETQPV